MNGYVLDACALIAYIEGESGADRVEAVLQSSLPVSMSAVNLLEVCYDVERTKGSSAAAKAIMELTQRLKIAVEWSMPESLILAASSLKARGRISLADAVALALAQQLGARLVTADHHEFDAIEQAGLAAFEWIR